MTVRRQIILDDEAHDSPDDYDEEERIAKWEGSDNRFKVSHIEIECPFPEHDGLKIPIEIGWVIPEAPSLHLKAPELVEHMRDYHGGN